MPIEFHELRNKYLRDTAAVHDADYRSLAHEYLPDIEAELASRRGYADNAAGSTLSEGPDSLAQNCRSAAALDREIHSATCQFVDGDNWVGFTAVDHMSSAEFHSQLQPVWRDIDGDDRRRAPDSRGHDSALDRQGASQSSDRCREPRGDAS
jgi:hypothetical protein